MANFYLNTQLRPSASIQVSHTMAAQLVKKHLSQPWFDLIKSGAKKYEGRINTGFWKDLKVKDTFIFYDGKEQSYKVEVVSTREYKNFKDGITDVGLNNILPPEADNTIEQAIQNVYYKYYSKQQEMTYGIVMLQFKVVS